jgi:hypothetical protein
MGAYAPSLSSAAGVDLGSRASLRISSISSNVPCAASTALVAALAASSQSEAYSIPES